MEKIDSNVERDTQLNKLSRVFSGLQAFMNLRGKLGVSLSQWLVNNNKEAKNITRSRSHLKSVTSDYAILNSLMYHLTALGYVHSIEELSRALSLPGYIMEREVITSEDTALYTLYMLEPAKTLRIIEFAKNHSYSLLDSVARRFILPLEDAVNPTITLSRQLLEDLPSLKEFHDMGLSNEYPLILAYIYDVLFSFPALDVVRALGNCRDLNNEFTLSQKEFWQHHQVENSLGFYHREAEWLEHKQAYQKLISSFTFLVRGSRSNTLQALGDPEGQRVAAWEFQLPTWLEEKLEQFKSSAFGFMPEADYGESREQFPVLTSQNMDHGFGVRLLENVEWRQYRYFPLYFG